MTYKTDGKPVWAPIQGRSLGVTLLDENGSFLPPPRFSGPLSDRDGCDRLGQGWELVRHRAIYHLLEEFYPETLRPVFGALPVETHRERRPMRSPVPGVTLDFLTRLAASRARERARREKQVWLDLFEHEFGRLLATPPRELQDAEEADRVLAALAEEPADRRASGCQLFR